MLNFSSKFLKSLKEIAEELAKPAKKATKLLNATVTLI
jgi:hypothetical protein